MTKLEIEIAKTLDGKSHYMAAILIDSFGDKLLIDLGWASNINARQYFTQCSECNMPVLDSSINSGGVCDHCIAADLTQTPITTSVSRETRIKEATELADTAFWKTVAACFPEAKTGDFSPVVTYDPEQLVRHWVNMNVPKVAEPWAEELGLHYFLSWHMLNTGGGVMVAVTQPTPDGWYFGVSAEHVILYQMKTGEWLEESEDAAIWEFGSCPTKLLTLINKFMGFAFNPNSLFDDIMTVGKSNKV